MGALNIKGWLLAVLFIIVIGISYPSQENHQIVTTQNDKLSSSGPFNK